MAIAERSAETIWEGSLAGGGGTVSAGGGAWDTLPVTWASRTERANGSTSPEELAAAAHSACFAMALALRLGEHQVTAERLSITATVTLDEVDGAPTIVSSALRVRGRVPGVDQAGFRAAVDEAAALCPVSRLFAGATISVATEFEPA
ncbi:MAG TPA: OsmC family peroxiredoxin [Pseudonocardiaceae bacterium]|jgi:osmotically inducible protein OsmC|nr:OsmC family peroxiredoxin [Pseudonocardiaceae bacterium]